MLTGIYEKGPPRIHLRAGLISKASVPQPRKN